MGATSGWGSVVSSVKASPALSGIEPQRPAKQNQSSPSLVNFHFDFGDFAPVNSKKCDAGTRQRPFGNRRPSERKLMAGARPWAAPAGTRQKAESSALLKVVPPTASLVLIYA
jgi:hypothetical protein